MLGVFGALAGAKALNEFVAETWGDRGPADPPHHGRSATSRRVRRRVHRDDYRVLSETERFGAAISAADLVLARSGSTVWEIAAAGRPAIFVPYPFATGDHQARNAEHFVRAGGAIMVRELDLEDVPELVRSLLDDPERRRADERGDAARRTAGRGGGDRRGADRAGEAPVKGAGSGSSGSAAPD